LYEKNSKGELKNEWI